LANLRRTELDLIFPWLAEIMQHFHKRQKRERNDSNYGSGAKQAGSYSVQQMFIVVNLCFINSKVYVFMLCVNRESLPLFTILFLPSHFEHIFRNCKYEQMLERHENVNFTFLSFDEFTTTL
jgi:hypothetical protein